MKFLSAVLVLLKARRCAETNDTLLSMPFRQWADLPHYHPECEPERGDIA